MNIQALSDTELNRAMIWLYPPAYSVCLYVARHRPMDYLSSWNLTMPLAVENGLDIAFIVGRASYGASFLNNYVISVDKNNPLRAICEVLVMIGMEGK